MHAFETGVTLLNIPKAMLTLPGLQLRQSIVSRYRTCSLALFALLAAGCQQLPYNPKSAEMIPQWTMAGSGIETTESSLSPIERWWELLHDPAINALVDTALQTNPDLAQAVARMDAARSASGLADSQSRPTIGASAGIARGSSQMSGGSADTQTGTSATLGLSLGWEVDLYERIKAGREAARLRLDARTAESRMTQVALVAQIADRVVNWRACKHIFQSRLNEISSQQHTLALVQHRVAVGMGSVADEARSNSDLALARTNALVQDEACNHDLSALEALSGLDAATVRDRLTQMSLDLVSETPDVRLSIPATVLLGHPNVISAQREAAAAWSEMQVAKANRLPRLDIAGLLTGQWLSMNASQLNYNTWSLGPTASAALFDGGAGEAQVSAAQARYQEVTAKAVSVVRSSAQDIENALAALDSADHRRIPAQQALESAQTALRMVQAQWRAGATSLLGLEDAKRQLMLAQNSVVAAMRDRSQSWIALVQATGNQGITPLPTHGEIQTQ